jgi:hypothetical protein
VNRVIFARKKEYFQAEKPPGNASIAAGVFFILIPRENGKVSALLFPNGMHAERRAAAGRGGRAREP